MTQDAENNNNKIKQDTAPEKERSARKSVRHSAFILAEIFAVILLIVAIVLGASIWRLSSGPVDIDFSKDYIEAALHSEEMPYRVSIENVALYWPDLRGPLLLGMQGARIADEQGREIMSVDEIALSLSKRWLILGQIRPKSFIIKKPTLRVVRDENDGIDFGFGTIDMLANENAERQQRDLIGEILQALRAREKSVENSMLALLNSFEIQGAQTVVEDYKLGATWFLPDMDLLLKRVNEGLNAKFTLNFPSTLNDDTSFIDVSMILKEAQSVADIDAEIKNFDLRVLAGKIDGLEMLRDQDIFIDASLHGRLDKGFSPLALDAELVSSAGALTHPKLSPKPIVYETLYANASYSNRERQRLDINALKMDFGKAVIHVQADMQEISDGNVEEAYKGSWDLRMDDMPHSAIEPLWPAFLEGDASEEWIVQKMGGGDLSGLRAEADFTLFKDKAQEWDASLSGLMAFFNFSNMNMDYRAPLPPVQNAQGSGIFNLDTDILTIDIESAEMGGMDVSQTGLTFKEVAAEGKGSVEMNISLKGPLRSVLEYISTEPIDLRDELGMDISKVRGDSDLRVEMSFPTKDDLQIEEIQMDIKAKVRNGFIPDILEGLPLEGGPFDVHVNNERYTVKGQGTYGKRPITLDWMEYLESEGRKYKSKAEISLNADAELRRHFGIDLSEFIEGAVPVDLIYTSTPNNRAEIFVKADVTPATFFVEPFKYNKPPGRKAEASLTVELANNTVQSVRGLKASAQGFKIDGGSLYFQEAGQNRELAQAVIDRFVIGETIASLTVDIAPSGLMKILLEGPFLDLRPFVADDENEGEKSYDGPPQIISVSVDQMRTADEQTVQYAKIYADIDRKGRFNQLEMDAIAGSGDIYMRYKPDVQGRRTFRFEADDAGATLRAFDVYRNIRGGKLVIYGEPISGVYDRNIVGVAQITDFKVVDAPSLARLLGALSLPGVLQLLNNDGLSFAKLEAGFDWLYRPQGALLVLKDGRTSGNSLGLTFDGVIDNAAMTVNLSGTIIPLSGINKVISSIPLVGDILSGGSGAIFAATYSMEGPSENPRILVNPLSVLTPGILRRILFE
ncbi:MAG: DUF3971 domain-containing protein [Alphaproteobacteria bacterium]